MQRREQGCGLEDVGPPVPLAALVDAHHDRKLSLVTGAAECVGRVLPQKGQVVPEPLALRTSRVRNMEGIVLRVRLVSGDSMDVTYEEPTAGSEDEVIDHVVSSMAEESGVLRCRHGGRLLVLYARGVAAVEVAPRGAVL